MVEILIALSLFFRQAAYYFGSSDFTAFLLGANLDPFFLVGTIGLFLMLKSGRLPFLRIYSLIVLVGVLQIVFIPNLSQVDWLINLTKLLLCVSAMFFVKEYFYKIRLSRVVVIFSILLAIGVYIANTFGQTETLWTLNDGINKFDLIRLKLTFLEPSELGFTLVILLITLIHLLYNATTTVRRGVYSACIIINVIALSYAKPLGAIVIGFLAGITMLAFQLLYVRPTLRKQVAAIAIFVISLFLVFSFFSSQSTVQNIDNTIVQRGVAVTEGDDSSINYRVGLSSEIAYKSLIESPITGQGFGNLSTDEFIQKYADRGLVTPLVNSYFGFIAEAGIVGLLLVLYIIFTTFKAAFRSKSFYAIGLAVFITVYQFTGSHFSNPLAWSIYGVIFAIDEMSRRKNKKVIIKPITREIDKVV